MWSWLWLACRGGDGEDVTASDTDTDTDTDADGDADADADTDTDTDTHTGATTTDGLVWDASRVLVVPDGNGLTLFASDGSVVFSATWTDLVGSCDACGGEGASDDGDGLLLAFTTTGPVSGGAVARLDGAGALDWRVDGFGFPHDVERDPADDTFVVVDTQRGRLVWIDGTSPTPLRTLDATTDPDWTGGTPNGAEKIEEGGRVYLLLSHRGGAVGSGWLSMWDVTTAGDPSMVWRFPATGGLGTPHGAVLRWYGGHRWLVYAHTDGLALGSSVGLALADDLTTTPVYVADLEPTGAEAPLDFLRGVELLADGTLILTDSGPGNGGSTSATGRVATAVMPAGLAASTRTGAFGDQDLVEVTPAPFASGLVNPFEGWLWQNTFP